MFAGIAVYILKIKGNVKNLIKNICTTEILVMMEETLLHLVISEVVYDKENVALTD